MDYAPTKPTIAGYWFYRYTSMVRKFGGWDLVNRGFTRFIQGKFWAGFSFLLRMFRLFWNCIEAKSGHPFFIALFTALAGYVLFVSQTNAQYENELKHAQFAALQDVTNFYGGMSGTLDHLASVRCELLDKRLTKAEINVRSAETREKVARFHEQSAALTFRIAALFSPREPRLRRFLRHLRVLPVKDKKSSVRDDDLLSVFQELVRFYLKFQERGIALVSKIPKDMTCESDDSTYLNEFHDHAPFKFAKVYNLMAPSLGISKLRMELKKGAPADRLQRFSVLIKGKPVKLECAVGQGNWGKCVAQ